MYELTFSHRTGIISVQVSPNGSTMGISHTGVTLWDKYLECDWDLPSPVPNSHYSLIANLLGCNDCIPASCIQEEYDELVSLSDESPEFESNPFVGAYLSSYLEYADCGELEVE